ncbi:protein lingerer-like isoform X2 [Anneissia japonica]|uniref:protein lingerer-like isoform X2 n=1 Tax=Anneissia japonica TaxID=1529436 RepID=UPI001425A141|nr:protein lingerer-like isoform X2 [Anneissia japonica]
MGATRANTRGGGKEKNTSQKSTTQTTTKSATVSETPSSKKMQATPDQLRMAQMLSADTGSDKSVEIQAQVQQVIDVTGKSEEAILTALHDCNYNTEQAIFALLDTADDPNEWQTISSKKSKSQQNMQSSNKQIDSTTDLKDSRSDKRERGDRGDDFKEGKSQRDGRSNRGRGRVPPRMARGRGRENGASRERDNDDQSFGGDRGFSNDRDRGFSNDRRFNDRNESGRGRGRRFDHMNGGGSRRGGRGGSRSFTNSKFGTFEGDAFTGAKPGDNVWTNPPKTSDNRNSRCNASNFTASTWDSVPKSKPSATPPCSDDWGIDDWTGDLSKSQVFTPSTTAPTTFKEDTSPPVYTPSMDSAVVSSTISAPGSQPSMPQSIDIATLLGKPPGSMSSPSPVVGESIQPPPRPQPDVFTQFAEMKPPSHTNKTIDQVVVPVQQVPVQQQRPAPVANQVKPARKKLPPPSKIPASAVEMPGSTRGLGSLDVQFGVMDMDPSSGFSIGINIPSSSAVPSTAQPTSSLPVSGSMPPGITQKPGVFSVEDSSVSSSYAYPSQRTDTFSASSLPSSNTGKVHLPFGGFEQASMTEKTSQNKNDLKANTYMSAQSQGSMDTYSTSQQSQMSRSTTSTLSSSVLSSTSVLHQSAPGYPQPHGSRTSQSSYGNTDQSSGPTGGLPNSRPSGKTDSYTGSVSTITGLGSNVMPSSAHGKGINPGSHNQGLSNTVPSGMNVSVPSSLTGSGSNAFGSSSLSSSSANSKSAASVGGGNALSGLTNSSQSTSHSGLGSSSLNTGLSGSSQMTTSSVSTHTSVQTSPMSSSKIGLDSRLDNSSHPSRGTSGLVSQTSLASASSLGVSPVTASTTSSSLGYISTSASSLLSSTRTTQASTS